MIRFHHRNKQIKNILNSSNTLSFYYSKDEDYVTKLKFFQLGKKKTIYNTSGEVVLKKRASIESNKVRLSKINPALLNFLSPQPKKKLQRFSLKKPSFVLYDKRHEHETFEEKREKAHEELSKTIEELKAKIKRTYQHLSQVGNKIEDIKIDIGVLNQFGRYSLFEDKFKKADVILDKLDFKKAVTFKSLIHQQISKIQDISHEKIGEKNNYTEEYSSLLSDIKKDEETLNGYKSKYKTIKNELIIHYHNLLREGKDTRNEGISWIIKRIWKLDEEVILSYLPSFLDSEAIEFLFIISRLSIEKEIQERQLKTLYKKVICCKVSNGNDRFFKTSSSSMSSNPSNSKRNYNLNSEIIKNLLAQIDKKLNMIERTAKISFHKIDNIINEGSNSVIDNNTNKYIQTIQNKKNYIKGIQSHIDELKNNQLERINKEFLNNNYQRRFNVPLFVVVSALVGEERLEQEMSKIQKESRMFAKTLRSVQSFSVLNFKKRIPLQEEDEDDLNSDR